MMKKLIKPIAFLAVIVLLYGAYALFGGRVANAFVLRSAEQARESGDIERAAKLYEQALESSPRDETLRLLVCDLYRESGNYSRAEYILFAGLRDVGPSVTLYKKLCAVYVEQDKLFDAVELLDNISSPRAREEITAARPAPPVFSVPGGRYEERIGVTLLAGAGHSVYVCWTGGIPSVYPGPLEGPVYLPPGVTPARAVAIDGDGLVSVWADCEYQIENVVDPVTFADPAVEHLIRHAIGRPDGLLYTSDLWKLTALTSEDPADYKTLDDLLYCPGLQELALTGTNNRCDISALPKLEELTGLSLTAFGIDSMDLEMVGECANLESLLLPHNSIGSIKPLESLERLTRLDLSYNSILDIGPLGKLGSLQRLRISHNAVADLDGLSPLSHLTELVADANRITSLGGVEDLTQLQYLDVSYNTWLNSLSELEKLASLKSVTAGHCHIEKIPDFSRLTSLAFLNVDSNSIPDIDGLAGLPSLSELSFANNGVASLEPLKECSSLNILEASRNSVSSVEPLRGLPLLHTVRVEYNVLRSILPLKECPSIKEIYAHGNALTDPLDAWAGTGVTPQRN